MVWTRIERRPDFRSWIGALVPIGALAVVNISSLYVVMLRDPERLHYRFIGYGKGPMLIPTAVFPTATTTLLVLAVAIVLAVLGTGFARLRLVSAYAATTVWCFGGAMLLRQRPDGNPNDKVVILALGVLVLWMAMTTTVRKRTPAVSFAQAVIATATAVATAVSISPPGLLAKPLAAALLGGACAYVAAWSLSRPRRAL